MPCESKNYPITVTVQYPREDATAGASGHIDWTDPSNWQTSETIKVRFLSRGGREGRVFDRVQAEVSHILETISTGFSRTIRPEWRAIYDDPDRGERIFNIVSAFDVDEAKRMVQIHVTEVV